MNLPEPDPEVLNLRAVPHKNTSTHDAKIDSDLIPVEDFEGDGARPLRVTVPPGAVVRVRAEYVARMLPPGCSFDPDSGLPLSTSIRKGVIEMLAPALQPHGDLAKRFVETVYHHQLPSVRRAAAENARRQKAEAADKWFSRADLEREVAERVHEVIGQRKLVEPPAPLATPRFVVEE